MAIIDGNEAMRRGGPVLDALARSRSIEAESRPVCRRLRIPGGRYVSVTAVFDTYWRFAYLRQAAFMRRVRGEPLPFGFRQASNSALSVCNLAAVPAVIKFSQVKRKVLLAHVVKRTRHAAL